MKALEVLESYEWDDNLKTFHIIHLYKGKLCGRDGIKNCRFFSAIGYNKTSHTRKDLGIHDEFRPAVKINQITIYADGSTLISFLDTVTLSHQTQTLWIEKEN